ncbi:putative phage tail protein [Paenibacillus sp. TAB 01]|uniref:putative phage tail protein n=1 Tax=Paenibacillus sp. TAB 01 TaxID=3368988 RepID=UPI003750113F
MSRSEEMRKRLQPFMRGSLVYKSIFDAEAAQFNSRDGVLSDLQAQLSVDTATWALDIYESELGIVKDASKPYSERRSVVKSKMRGTGKIDAALIKIVADSFTNGDVEVTFDGHIRIQFVSVIGSPPNVNDLYAAIENIKPAHLPVNYSLRYLTISEVESMTIAQIESTTLDRFAGGGV